MQAASPRWEPQIAVLCEAGQVYQPQYLSEEGRWQTDLSKKSPIATCLRDKLDLLNYCKKVNVKTKTKNRLYSILYGNCSLFTIKLKPFANDRSNSLDMVKKILLLSEF